MYSNEILTSYKQCWHLVELINLASVGQQVLAVVFLTSVDSLLCTASIFSLPPSADCVLLWTATSNRLFSSAFRSQLTLSSLGHSFPPPLPSQGRSRPQAHCVGFAPKQRDYLTGANTNGIECYLLCHKTICITKGRKKRTYQHWRQYWCIDTTTRGLHRKTRRRTDYGHQKRYWQHGDQQNDNNSKTKMGRKQLHECFKQLIKNIRHERTWTWLRKENFKRETESLVIAAQNNAVIKSKQE